jgi:hypothetical protein
MFVKKQEMPIISVHDTARDITATQQTEGELPKSLRTVLILPVRYLPITASASLSTIICMKKKKMTFGGAY